MHERERRQIVARIVREGDPDHYLAALFAPKAAREPLLALYALNVELGRIAALVKEPVLGEIRLQWWRQAIDKAAAGEATGHPVADALGETIKRRALSRQRVGALTDARAFDVSEKIMPNGATLEAYLHDTAGALFQLAGEILGGERGALEPAATSAGLAYGLTGMMRAIPHHAAEGRVDLPADLLLRHGSSPERLLAGEVSAGLTDLLVELRDAARAALGEALRHLGELAQTGQTAFLPLCLVDPYLRALKSVAHDPLRQIADINPLYRLWRFAMWR